MDAKAIKLSQNLVAFIDAKDFRIVSKYSWHATKNGNTFYACTNVIRSDGKRRLLQMHRLILGLNWDDKRVTDHIDFNGLNNQRSNLRICNKCDNIRYRSKQRNGQSSYFKGVIWDKDENKWRARIGTKGVMKHLGRFDSEVDAAKAYDDAARKLHGAFAFVNL